MIKLKHLLENTLHEDANMAQAENLVDIADETNDIAMEQAIAELFGDMTEQELESYLSELQTKKPKWLKKLMRWIKKMKNKLPSKGEIRRKRVKRKQKWEDNPELQIAKTTAFITWNTLGTVLLSWWYKNFGREQLDKIR